MSKAEFNAYRRAPDIRSGCTHQLGCRCEAPFWLRPSTPAEEEIADRIFRPHAVWSAIVTGAGSLTMQVAAGRKQS